MMPTLLRKTAVLMTVFAAGFGLEAGGHKHKTKPAKLCEIPNYDYRTDKVSGLVTAVSRTAVIVESAGTANALVQTQNGTPVLQAVKDTRRSKYFQLPTPYVAIDHCSISRVVVTLDDQQNWTVTLRADQNPQAIGAVPIAGDPSRLKQTGQFKRNEFFVNVRFLGAYQGAAEDPKKTEGRPVILKLEPIRFWVQNSEPLDVFRSGKFRGPLGDLATFNAVDRIEIDFSYKQ